MTPAPPMTVGIYGKWGRGKTSVMRLLRGQLADEAATRNVGTSDALCHICTGTNRSAIRDLRDWRGGSDDTNALSLNDFRRIWRPRRSNIRSLFCGLENRCTRERTVGSNPIPSATLKSLLCRSYSGHSMDSNLSRNFRGLRLMRPAVVAC